MLLWHDFPAGPKPHLAAVRKWLKTWAMDEAYKVSIQEVYK